jgi:nucleotide-binding universal stress UspA family protein
MIEIRNILCPVDFSDFSRRAVDHAVAVARWYGSTLTLFHVAAVVPVAAYGPGSAGLAPVVPAHADREELLRSLRRFADEGAGTGVPIELDLAEGDVAATILARSEAMAHDLIVMGTHGRSGFERLLLGSVTEKVLRKASCPVLTVPRHAPDAVPAPPVLFKRILCATDFSDCSANALSYAMSLAQETDAHLTVVHVLELPPELSPDVEPSAVARVGGLREYVAATQEERRARLREAVPESIRAYCTVDTVLASGKPSREILRAAEAQRSELIVIGIQGRGAADRLFFGSTAEYVVRHARCPVLTIRRDGV